MRQNDTRMAARREPMLNDTQRAKILGLNAARLFKLEVPKHQRLDVQ